MMSELSLLYSQLRVWMMPELTLLYSQVEVLMMPEPGPGPVTGWDTWEFFSGAHIPGGPMGAHSKGNLFSIENFWTRKMILRLT